MSTLYDETFAAHVEGTALTSANTAFTNITGSGTFTATPGVTGSSGRFATTTAARKQASVVFAVTAQITRRFYLRLPATHPPANISVYDLKATAIRNAAVRVTTAGKLQLRSLDVQKDITDTALVIGDWYRVEHMWNQAAGSQELRVFWGPNLHGTIPDETLTGPAEGNPADEITIGINNSVAGWSWDLDDDRVDTGITWIGPSVTTGVISPSPAQATTLALETMLVTDRGLTQYDGYWSQAARAAVVKFTTDVGADLFAAGDTTLRRGDSEVWSVRQWRPVYGVAPGAYDVLEAWDRPV